MRLKFYCFFALVFWQIPNSFASDNACPNPWKEVSRFANPIDWKEFAYDVPLLDKSNVYNIARFRIPANADIALKISGSYPEGRYFGITVYDQSTADKVDPAANIVDANTVADAESSNPFSAEFDQNSNSRQFTVWAMPRPYLEKWKNQNDNLVTLTSGRSEQYIEIVQRIYAPYENHSPPKLSITAYAASDLTTPVSCAKQEISPTRKDLSEAHANRPPTPDRDGILRFYTPEKAANIVANPDTLYMSTQFTPLSRGMAIVAFKPPVAAAKNPELNFPDLRDPSTYDVRFFSLCMTGGVDMITFECRRDTELIVDQGLIKVVFADTDPRNQDEKKRLNFIPWPYTAIKVLLYRQLLPNQDFLGGIFRVKGLPNVNSGRRELSGQDIKSYAAERYIGSFAPRGIHCLRNCNKEDLFSKFNWQ